jgi:hypothetical protein
VADPYLIDSTPVAIANGASLSAQVNIGGKTLVAISIPSNWVTAGLTFQHSPDGGVTWGELQTISSGALAAQAVPSITGGAQTEIAIDPTQWRGITCIKVRSGTVGSPVNQTASGGVSLTLLTRFIE